MVKNDDFVQIHYTGKFEDGEIFDSSLERQPLEFKVGSGMVIQGLDKALLEMKVDEEKDIVIPPEEAYGDRNESLIHSFPLTDIQNSFQPEIGMSISVQMENGATIPASIIDITEDSVVLDANHPLAGKTLHFNFKLIEINDEPKLTPDPGCSDGNCSDTDCSEPGCSDKGCGC